MASGQDPGFRGLPGQPFGVRGGRVGGGVGVLIRGQRYRAVQERHARHLQFYGQGYGYVYSRIVSSVSISPRIRCVVSQRRWATGWSAW